MVYVGEIQDIHSQKKVHVMVCALLQGVDLQVSLGVPECSGESSPPPHPRRIAFSQHFQVAQSKYRQRQEMQVTEVRKQQDIKEKESRVWEGNKKNGGEKKNKSKDQNKEQNKVRTLLCLRLEFLTWLLLNHHLCYHHGQEAGRKTLGHKTSWAFHGTNAH